MVRGRPALAALRAHRLTAGRTFVAALFIAVRRLLLGGAPTPTPTVTLYRVKKTSVYLEPDLDEALARRAADEGLTKAEFIRRTLAGAVQRPKRPKPRAVGLRRRRSGGSVAENLDELPARVRVRRLAVVLDTSLVVALMRAPRRPARGAARWVGDARRRPGDVAARRSPRWTSSPPRSAVPTFSGASGPTSTAAPTRCAGGPTRWARRSPSPAATRTSASTDASLVALAAPPAHRPHRDVRPSTTSVRSRPPTGNPSSCSPPTPLISDRPRRTAMSTNSFDARATLNVGDRDARHLPPRRAAVQVRRRAAAVLPQGPAREPAAHRGQRLGRRPRTSRRSRPGTRRPSRARRSPSRPRAWSCRTSPACPAVVDLAAMRDAMADLGGDPATHQPARPGRARHRPLGPGRRLRHARRVRQATPSASSSATASATSSCAGARTAFDNFAVVPPDTGIVHQVNLEYLARVVFVDEESGVAYPDTLVGTDSHTTMINGLGVLGWGVGGIEAEAAMLGQPMSMLIPQVHRLQAARRAARGRDRDRPRAHRHRDAARARASSASSSSSTARASSALPLADRATIGNMSPEFGSTCAIFPIDERDAALPRVHRPPAGAGRPRRGLREGAGPLARREQRGADVLRHARARPRRRRAVARRPEAPAGPRAAGRRQGRLPRRAVRARRRGRRAGDRRPPRRGGGRDVPGLRPAGQRRARPRGRPERARAGAGGRPPARWSPSARRPRST